MLLTGCKTVKFVPVPEYHTLYKTRADTVWRMDSVRDVQWMTIKEVDSTQLAALGIQIKGLKTALLIAVSYTHLTLPTILLV